MDPANPRPPDTVTFGEFSQQVLALYTPPIRRLRTSEPLTQVLREFGLICPTTADITPGAIARWISAYAARRSPIRAFALLRSFAAAVKAGKELGLVPSDPFSFRSPRRWWPDGELDPPDRRRHLSADQARRLLDRADHEASAGGWRQRRLQALVRLYLFTGLRKSEALGLRVEDLDLGARTIAVRPNTRRHLKPGASRRRVPVPDGLRDSLASWAASCGSEWLFPGATRVGPWFGGPPGYKPLDEVKALAKRAGLDGVTILMLRHTFATLGESAGLGELMLQRLLGHRRASTQRHYRHEDEAALREAGELVRI